MVINVREARCENCGAIILDDDANRRLIDALRLATGLFRPGEIRAAREALGLTQEGLANSLQIAEAHSPAGGLGQIQQRSLDKLLRVFFGGTERVKVTHLRAI